MSGIINEIGSKSGVIDKSRFYMGSTTRNVATTGTQAITGVGFRPKQVLFMAGIDDDAGCASWGWDNGTTKYRMTNRSDTAQAVSESSSTSIGVNIASGVSETYGVISAIGSDGFTINWTKGGAPTGTVTIYFLAFR